MDLLKDKICLVTGSSKGIGRAIVKKMVLNGAIVYANAREKGSLDGLVEEVENLNKGRVIPVYFDVTNFDEVKKAILTIKKESGTLDVLVNNAGTVSYEVLGMVNFDHFRTMMEVNVISVVNLMQLAVKLMKRKKSGSIINISSIVGEKGSKGQLSYSATKGALSSLTKSASKDLAEYNIRVNAIAPGMIGTERLKKIVENKFNDKVNDIGLGRLGFPEEVADACLFLASNSSTYMTGQVIQLEGSLKI